MRSCVPKHSTVLPIPTLSDRLRSEDEARDTFKMLKSQLIGESFAELYVDWARLEHAAGPHPTHRWASWLVESSAVFKPLIIRSNGATSCQ